MKISDRIIDSNRETDFLCQSIGSLVGARNITVSLLLTEQDPFLLEDKMRICKIDGCNKSYHAKELCGKHYHKQWRKDNKEYIAEKDKKYREANKKHIAERKKQYAQDNKEKMRLWYHKWSLKNKEKIAQYQRNSKEKMAKRCKRYSQTPKGKASRKRKKYRRRQLGFIPLNDPFPNCRGHHIDKERIIYIPKELHISIYHSVTKNINMEKINRLAFKFLSHHEKCPGEGLAIAKKINEKNK